MIYSITIAPCIDYSLSMGDKEVRVNGVNRPAPGKFSVGGKGITVSRMLKNLKVDSIPMIAVGGNVGEDIKRYVAVDFPENVIYLPTEENSRIDVVVTGSNLDLRFDPPAPKIAQEGLNMMFDYLKKNLKEGDIVILSGSLGQEDKHLYAEIMDQCINPAKALAVLDTVDEALTNALASKPFMIKPNDEELSDLLGKEIKTEEDILAGGEELKKKGPKTVMVTMGKKGAYYFAEDGSVYHCSNATGKQISAVGAGDSSIAGLIKGLAENLPIEKALQYSMAAGGATAFSENLGSYELWESLIPQIKVTKIR